MKWPLAEICGGEMCGPRSWTAPPSLIPATSPGSADPLLAENAGLLSSKYPIFPQNTAPLERSFAHVLGAGGLRRLTLRGLEDLSKRHQIAAACYDLSQLPRRLYGKRTPPQWATCCWLLIATFKALLLRQCGLSATYRPNLSTTADNLSFPQQSRSGRSSVVC